MGDGLNFFSGEMVVDSTQEIPYLPSELERKETNKRRFAERAFVKKHQFSSEVNKITTRSKNNSETATLRSENVNSGNLNSGNLNSRNLNSANTPSNINDHDELNVELNSSHENNSIQDNHSDPGISVP